MKFSFHLFLLLATCLVACSESKSTEGEQSEAETAAQTEPSDPVQEQASVSPLVKSADPFLLRGVNTRIDLSEYFSPETQMASIDVSQGLEAEYLDSMKVEVRVIGDIGTYEKLTVKTESGDSFVFLLEQLPLVSATLRLKDQGYKTVELAGQMTQMEPQAMKKVNGIWEAQFQLLPKSYYYRFIVDGKSMLDPKNDLKTFKFEEEEYNLINLKKRRNGETPELYLLSKKASEMIFSLENGGVPIVMYNNQIIPFDPLEEGQYRVDISGLPAGSQIEIYAQNEYGSAAPLNFTL